MAKEAGFIYEYDFGDGWEHDVAVEKVLSPDPSFKHPICLDGANACPPEDCGGSFGYADFLKAMANPNHPDHEQMKEWIGTDWNPKLFSIDRVNAKLRKLKA